MMDYEKIREGVRLLLEGIGEDVDREGLRETPDRIARMYGEIFSGMDENAGEHLAKTFAVASNEIVLVKDITFYSICEHHLMPFYGKAHIAYIPKDGGIIGLSKFARIVDCFARRPQVQERAADSGADDHSDCRSCYGALKAAGCDCHGGGGASLYDHAGGGETGEQDNDTGVQRLFSGRSEVAGTVFSYDRREQSI